MRIKQLELCGFKSFVDPTVLEFSRGISAIIGPNGCGKSNIVDALRWVLGEQSASRLRGDVMEDVIFNGSERRGPVGMAEVSLLLENEGQPAGDLSSDVHEFLRDVPEVLVTRRYYRSGESEYLINRRACRLKDITELFLGTGVGTRAYALIEQGRVDQLINAKPEDLRLFIEEAAGTTLYRSRRLAAERKMERTRENLARVRDILHEIDREIATWRRIAKRAEQYRLAQAELRAVELQLGRRTFDRLSEEIAAVERLRSGLVEEERALAAAIDRLEEDRDLARRALAEAEEDFRRRQEALFTLRSTRERREGRLEMLGRERAELAERSERERRESAAGVRRGEEISAERERRRAALADLDRQRCGLEQALAAAVGGLEGETEEVERLSARLEAAKTEIVECLRREAEVRNLVASARRQIEERGRRAEVLSHEVASIERESAADAESADRTAESRRLLDERLAGLNGERDRVGAAVERLRGERSDVERKMLDVTGTLADVESRLAAAEDLDRGYGRYDEGVRASMQRRRERPNGILNLVAEVLEAPPELEKAVAAVLGERLQYVIVRTPDDAREAVRELKESQAGRSSFVPLEPRSLAAYGSGAEAHGASGALVDLAAAVQVEEGYGALAKALLDGAVVVPDLETGIALWRQNGHWRTLVTPDGEVVQPNGVISGGSSGPYEERLLAHRREIRRLRDEAARLRREQEQAEERRSAVVAELASAAERLDALDEAIRRTSVESVSLEKDAQRLAESLSRARSLVARSRSEIESLEREAAALAEEIEAAAASARSFEAERSAREAERDAIGAELAARRAELERRSREATELRVALAQAKEKEQALRDGLAQLDRQCEDLDARAAGLAAERDAVCSRAAAVEREAAELAAEVERAIAEEASGSAAFERSRASAEELRSAIERIERELAERRESVDRTREERGRHDVSIAEATLRRDHTVTTIRERYATELADVVLEPGDQADLERRFQELRQRVERIDRSQVGAEATGELGELEQRRESLVANQADLERAIADLQKTIASLNRASRDRFAETFAAVNEKFQETFPKLFRGGRARLVYTDDSNLLETGVDIEAQPPGMNLRTLSLLSGGQKALTAVSLIFSLFLHRPSPFCVLDEVDAPLDDANIDRFNGMVREMGDSSQFLLITHNKRTMEVAETLYGVTMEEPGVSKIVSVRFQRAA